MRKVFVLILTLLLPWGVFAVEGPMQKIGQAIDQTATYMIIMSKIAKDPLLDPFDIKVTINNGTAILTGEVDTNLQYDRAMMLAMNTEGIDNVDVKNLKIRESKDPFADALITAKIKGNLFKEKYVRGHDVLVWPITASTYNGTVYVIGEVASPEQKQKILKVIENTKGIKALKEDIRVSSPS